MQVQAPSQVCSQHSVNNRPVKRLALSPTLSPAAAAAIYIVPHASWNYGIMTPFYNSKLGRLER